MLVETFSLASIAKILICKNNLNGHLKKAAKIWGRHHWFLRKMTFGNDCRNFILATSCVTYPDLSSASDCNFPSANNQSETLPRSGYWHLISMKFLQSFHRETSGGVEKCRLFSDGCSVQLMQGCDAARCSHVGWHRPRCRPKQLLIS